MQLGLLAGIEVNPVQAIVTPDVQQHVRPGRAAEGYSTDFLSNRRRMVPTAADDHKSATLLRYLCRMFVKFCQRSRAYTTRGHGREPHRTVIVQLVESERVDGRSRQRIVAHLGTCREPVERDTHRLWFHERCNKVLDGLDLSAEDRAKVAAQIAARIPPPTAEQAAEMDRRAAEVMAGSPDGFTTLMRAWNAATDSERAKFIDRLRRQRAI